MNLDTTIASIQRAAPGCVAAGFIDFRTGKLLSAKTFSGYSHDSLELAAAASSDLFEGPNVSSIERAFGRVSGEGDGAKRPFDEIVVFSDSYLHVFRRCRGDDALVLVVVCRSSANIGMTLVKARASMALADKH